MFGTGTNFLLLILTFAILLYLHFIGYFPSNLTVPVVNCYKSLFNTYRSRDIWNVAKFLLLIELPRLLTGLPRLLLGLPGLLIGLPGLSLLTLLSIVAVIMSLIKLQLK